MATGNIPKQDFSPVINRKWGQNAIFAKAAKTTDIPVGKMIHVEVEGIEILIANVEGKFYAVGDRCPHLNALLSKGTLDKTIVTCSRHFSSFDVTNGRAISGTPSSLQVYEVKVAGNDLLVKY
jgi:nitrite reductase/ring-hydroxylating ferredoxin subunit